jgi:hypothetical protein
VLKNKKVSRILSGVIPIVFATLAEAYHDPCQPHSQHPRKAPATYNQPSAIEDITPSDSGIWHIVINGETYRICPQTYLAAIKPNGREEKIPVEDIQTYQADSFKIEFVEGDGVRVVTALIFNDP